MAIGHPSGSAMFLARGTLPWSPVERTSPDGGRKLVVAHVYPGAPEAVDVDLAEGFELEAVFAEDAGAVTLCGNALRFALGADSAAAALLRRKI